MIAGPPCSEAAVVQLGIPGLSSDHVRVTRATRCLFANWQSSEWSRDPLIQTYLRRLAARGAAKKGLSAYRYQLRWILREAANLAGHPVSMEALFMDTSLLGRALVDDTGSPAGRRLSKWTLAQRRSAIRSFADLMRPELLTLLGADPRQALDHALRGVAQRVGTGYQLTGGTPRRRGGIVPTSEEITAVISEAGRAPGFAGRRNVAFFDILAVSGTRINALLQLDGADCILLPSGRLRLFLHEKGKLRQREIELTAYHAEQLLTYLKEYNLLASHRGWRTRIRLGDPGPIWRNSGRGRWPYNDVLVTLRAACAAAAVRPFTPHALRRAFATDAASILPRHVVALAGGWRGLDRLDDHYVQPRQPHIWEKLHDGELRKCDTRMVKDDADEAAVTIQLSSGR